MTRERCLFNALLFSTSVQILKYSTCQFVVSFCAEEIGDQLISHKPQLNVSTLTTVVDEDLKSVNPSLVFVIC